MAVMKDPICGMDVDPVVVKKKGLITTKNGKKYYFCNQNCKDKFEGGEDKGKKNEPWYRSQTFGNMFPGFLAVVLIVGFISAIYLDFMLLYMGIFFIIFSLMKMPDWKGFVKAFSQYDLIAKNVKFYGWVYPAIEFGLGILYLTNTFIPFAAWITVFVLGIGAVGVGKNMLTKNKVQCACLGTKIKVPLTKVTLLENLLMVIMAIMLISGFS